MKTKRKISMPYWCVANPVGDPFGPHVMDRIDSVQITDILCNARKSGLIDFTSAHDDDLVEWGPNDENDDKNSSSETYKKLKTIKEKLATAGLGFTMITCGLHGDPVFRRDRRQAIRRRLVADRRHRGVLSRRSPLSGESVSCPG